MYNQNDCINLLCEGATTIPTDGLVLRGWYTTITLAVYGTLTKNIMEQIASPPAESHVQLNDADKMEAPLSLSVSAEEPKEVADIDPSSEEVGYTKYVQETPPKDPRQFPATVVDTGGGEWPLTDPIERDAWDKSGGRSRRSPGRRKSETRRSYSRSSSRDESYAANRDWSRSPDSFHNNSNRRSSRGISGGVEVVRKRPRTPPMMTDALSSPGYNNNNSSSSRRPRSPDHVIPLSDDDQRREHFHRSKERSLAPEDLARAKALQSPTSTPGTPLESPVAGMGLEDDPQTAEQFELIESDEEIGDDMDQFDFDFDEYEESMKLFNPMDLQRFQATTDGEEGGGGIGGKIGKEFEAIAKALAKFSGVRRKEFEHLSRDEREGWVHGMERVVGHLTQVYHCQRSCVEPAVDRLADVAMETIVQCLRIGLDYECAMCQVAYKVRHLKVGLRLAELICCYDRVAQEVLQKEQFNVFQGLFDLYNEQFMAMSLQMMILKSMGSILDTKSAVVFFLAEDCVGGVNYYQRLLKMIEQNPKIYLKFALKAIVKKLNVFETLECVKEEAASRATTATGTQGTRDDTVLNGCLSELLDTYVWNALGLAHSKHFVPVPQKIEIAPDEMTTRSVAHCVDSYFRAHALLEALSLLVVQRTELSMTTSRLVIDVLRAIARDSFGFVYLVERFETTMVIVRSLLQNTTMEDWNDAGNEWMQLGVEIAYKVSGGFGGCYR